jgi:RNA polymerase sigma-70 factor (ECF subfamily)
VDFFRFDSGYLERLAAGDAAAEDHFHRYFGELICIKLRARHLPPHAVDDIRQETFLRVFQALRKQGVRQPESIGSYVNSVCNNVLLEWNRAGSRTTFVEQPPETPDISESSEQRLIARERRERVREILARMPERNRQLLTAVFLEERSVEQVCKDFGVDRDYLRVLLFRARAQLRRALRREEHRNTARER